MKSNLDHLYKTSTDLEKEGVWFEVTDEIGFLIRRFGGYNASKVKKALAKYHKPYAAQIANGSMPHEKEAEIYIRVFVESSMLDWKGIEIDGVVTPFSVDEAVKLLKGLPDLTEAIIKQSSSSESFREDLGNS